ncbi:MAG TPA: hypothetical protein VFV50_13230, partial [Bdellovibrionales bacterium]|nr:hypothetical protein [Bdellovibrionales bacterium]
MKFAIGLLSFLLLSGAVAPALAQTDYLVLRRLVVFPFDAPANVSGGAERAWWKVREELTNNRRFLIASKQFM